MSCVSSPNEGSGTTSDEAPQGTCFEILDSFYAANEDPHPVSSFWLCAFRCGLTDAGEGTDHSVQQSTMSYDQLEPGQPDGCYELRTALYQCLDALTCEELAQFREAGNAMQDGPCTAEYFALEPRVPACGI